MTNESDRPEILSGSKVQSLFTTLGLPPQGSAPAVAKFAEHSDRDCLEVSRGGMTKKITRFTSGRVEVIERVERGSVQTIIDHDRVETSSGQWDPTAGKQIGGKTERLTGPFAELARAMTETQIPAAFKTAAEIRSEMRRNSPPSAPKRQGPLLG